MLQHERSARSGHYDQGINSIRRASNHPKIQNVDLVIIRSYQHTCQVGIITYKNMVPEKFIPNPLSHLASFLHSSRKLNPRGNRILSLARYGSDALSTSRSNASISELL